MTTAAPFLQTLQTCTLICLQLHLITTERLDEDMDVELLSASGASMSQVTRMAPAFRIQFTDAPLRLDCCLSSSDTAACCPIRLPRMIWNGDETTKPNMRAMKRHVQLLVNDKELCVLLVPGEDAGFAESTKMLVQTVPGGTTRGCAGVHVGYA